MKRIFGLGSLLLLLVIALNLNALAQRKSDAPLAKQIDAILNERSLASGYQGVEVASVNEKQILYSHNAERVFLPASNNKLLTSSAALALLGPDFTYKTVVRTNGKVYNGRLTGDLAIIGSGDPTLSSEDLNKLATDVRAAGITSIGGGVRYDATIFDEQWLGDSWTWDDEPFYYSAQIAGLNVDRNVTLVTVTPGDKAGEPARVTLAPGADACMKVENTAVTWQGDGKPHLYVERKRGENTITVDGTIPPTASARSVVAITFENPALYTATLFTYALRQAGVSIDDKTVAKSDKGVTGAEVASHTSVPFAGIIVLMNKPSDNMIAECLLKTIGAAKRKVGTAGGSGTGALAARNWLTSIGLQASQFRQVDGSGLSRQDYVSPANLVKLLEFWRSDPKYDLFFSSLPIAGVDGTLRNRMKGTAAENNCRAKTGSLSQVSCISGYVTSKDGVLLAFSIMMNNQLGSMAACTDAENRIVELLANSTVGSASEEKERSE